MFSHNGRDAAIRTAYLARERTAVWAAQDAISQAAFDQRPAAEIDHLMQVLQHVTARKRALAQAS